MGIIEGALQFATSLPGFGVGVIRGTQNMLESLQQPTNLSDLYNAFMGGLEEGAEMLEPATYKPHIPEAELVGATAMAPWTGAQMALNKIADDPIYDSYPNLKGYLKFSGFVGGAKLMGKLYHPKLTKGLKNNITDISEQAMKMREAHELVGEIPEGALKSLRLKELEIQERGIHEKLAVLENKIQRPKTLEELGVKKVEREVPELTKRLEGRTPYTAKVGKKPKAAAAEKGLAKDVGKSYQVKPGEVSKEELGVPSKKDKAWRPPLFEFERGKESTTEQKLKTKLVEIRKEKNQVEKRVKRRFDLGRDTYEMNIGGKTKIVKATPKGFEEVKGEVKKEPLDLFKEKEKEVTAEFRGWQENVPGKPPIALYNVKGGKFDKSTVTKHTLETEGIKVPEPTEPAPKVVKIEQKKKKASGLRIMKKVEKAKEEKVVEFPKEVIEQKDIRAKKRKQISKPKKEVLKNVKDKLTSKELNLMDTIDPDVLIDSLIKNKMSSQRAESIVEDMSVVFMESKKPIKTFAQFEERLSKDLLFSKEDISLIKKSIPAATLKGDITELTKEARKVGEIFDSALSKKGRKKAPVIEMKKKKKKIEKLPGRVMSKEEVKTKLLAARKKSTVAESKLSPREYQEKYPEKTVHEDWDKANSPRFVFEGAGDILRELQKNYPDPGYVKEKLRRIHNFFKEKHPDDTMVAVKKYAPIKLKRLIEQYKGQPTISKPELMAKKAILALLEERTSEAKKLYADIEKNISTWAKSKRPKVTKVPPEATGLTEEVRAALEAAEEETILETFGFQTAYEKATEWTKSVKEGRETKVRESVDKMREDYLTPVKGNPLDRAAINYLRSETYSDYLKGMPSIGELKPNEVFRYDPTSEEYIATYKTKEGKVKPALRQSGYYALPEFADAFDKTMDIGKLTAAWTDPTRMLEQLDQGKWGGMAQKHILWPTRMTVQAKLRWSDRHKADLNEIFEKHKITSGRKRKAAGDILEQIDNERLNIPVNDLLQIKEIKEAVKRYKPKTQATIVEGTKSLRGLLNKLLDEENKARVLRGQKAIPYRKFYRTWIMEANLWAKLSGQRIKPKEIMESPEMPDFIKPNNAFISHAERRTGLLAEYHKERDIGLLLSDYIETAAKDIFDTNIVHNNKIHTSVLRGKGLENAANAIDSWTAEAFAGISPRLTRWAKETIPPAIRGTALKIRRNLTRAVFPLNWTWNAFIQTSSSGITYARYGNKATLAGLKYFTPTMRRAIKQNAYSGIIKRRWGGKTHYQDIQNSILKNKRLDAKPIEKAEDFANFLTSAVEDALTGHAISAAYYDGKTRLNLKGRELWEYASEGGAKTQSMYNYQDLPGLLRAKEVGTLMPFQTFAFEVFNTVREMNIPVIRRVIGKTGLYETMNASSVAGKALLSKRLMMIARWTAAIAVTNAVVEKAIGRKPWVLSSFLPFLGYILGGKMVTGYPGRGPDFTPKRYIDDFRRGITDVLVSEDFMKLRKWAIKYHALAGVQIERMIEGIEAVSKEGRVKDIKGRMLYKIKTEDYLKALIMGPTRTEAARKYYEKRDQGSSLLEKLRKKKKTSNISVTVGD